VVVLHTLQASLHNAHDDDDDDKGMNEVYSLHQGVHFNSNFGCREPKENT
jgi:hypothetical protein